MKKHISFIYSISVLVLVVIAAAPAIADAMVDRTPATVGPSGQTVVIPERAIQVADHVFDLGTAIDPQTGKVVQGYAILRFKDEAVKPDHIGKPPKEETSTCYGYLAREASWKTLEPWMVNGANTEGLDPQAVFENLEADIAKWEDAANGTVGDGEGVDVLGNGQLTSLPIAIDTVSPDGKNEVVFGSIDDSGAIAVTIIWGIFGGPPKARELVEWDMVFDQTDFDWAMNNDPSKMDFESIATHELGHAAGMGDLYETVCNQETMYGYASEGEFNKRDLNAGDITGIDKLY